MKMLISLIVLSIATYTFAGPPTNYTLRNANGSYAGRMQTQGSRTNVYGANGRYQGRFEQRGSSYNRYSASGRYQGRVTTRK